MTSGAAPFRLHTLGTLRLDGADGEVRSLRRKERLVLAWLARRQATPVRRSELAALFWGERTESSARHALRQTIFSLRKLLGDGLIATGDVVQLQPDLVSLDLAELEACLARGEVGELLTCWGGEFLPELDAGPEDPLGAWLHTERGGLRRLLEGALDALADAAADSGDYGTLLAATQRFADTYPWDDTAQARRRAALQSAGGAGTGPDVPAVIACWQSVVAGPGALVRIVGGDILETRRACHTLVATVGEARGTAFVLSAAAAESDGAWGAAARLLAPLRSAPGLSGVDDEDLAEVARLVPSIRDRFPRLPQPVGSDAALSRAATRTLAGVAMEVPLLLVVEDAAALDAETRDWLLAVAADIPAHVMLALADGPAHCEPDPRLLPLSAASHRVQLTMSARAVPPAPPMTPPDAPVGAGRLPTRRRAALAGRVALLTAGLALVAFGFRFLTTRAADPYPVLAVGAVNAFDTPSDDASARALPELLTTQLARVPELQVISRAQMQELLSRESGELAAARAAGAREVLEGELYARPGGGYRLELRRVAVLTGRVLMTYSVDAAHGIDLGHQAASAVARSLGLREPEPPTWEGGSVAARALYDEGLRAHYSRDPRMAYDLFMAALEHDSTFATAALYAALAGRDVLPTVEVVALFERADALATNAPDRDRLLIRAYAALNLGDASVAAVVDTLAIRYPLDPTGLWLRGAVHVQQGRFLDAIAAFQRVLDVMPAPNPPSPGRCTPCDAWAGMVQAYQLADSFPAAARVAREWARAQPDEVGPWTYLATLFDATGQAGEAAIARQRVAERRSEDAVGFVFDLSRSIRAGAYDAADSGLASAARSESVAVATRAAWWQVVSFRYQGRLREAEVAAARLRALHGDSLIHPWATAQAVVLLEAGHAARAALLLDSILHALPSAGRPSRLARDQAWLLTLQGAALAAAGDTSRLILLVDSVRKLGSLSLYGRDRRLHHHLRGLLQQARGRPAEAEAEFRAAIYSPVGGYTRSNLHLAQALGAQGRHAEALEPLRSALRAPLDGPAYWLTRPDLYEALGTTFHAVGRADSAAFYYEKVMAAWRRAEAPLDARRSEVARRRDELPVRLRVAARAGAIR